MNKPGDLKFLFRLSTLGLMYSDFKKSEQQDTGARLATAIRRHSSSRVKPGVKQKKYEKSAGCQICGLRT